MPSNDELPKIPRFTFSGDGSVLAQRGRSKLTQIDEADLAGINHHLLNAFEIANGRFPTWIVDRLNQIIVCTRKMHRAASRGPVFCEISRRRTVGERR